MERIKLPFIVDYKFLEVCDVDVATSILGEYNDFVLYNAAQYGSVFEEKDEGIEDETEEAIEGKPTGDKNADLFKKLFASRDFAESCLVGVKIDYYTLQEILITEHKNRVPASDSKMNIIAPYLRDCVSTLVIGEKVMHRLLKLGASEDVIIKARANFENAIELLGNGFAFNMPEYTKFKDRIADFKTADGLLKMSAKVAQAAIDGSKICKAKLSDIITIYGEVSNGEN